MRIDFGMILAIAFEYIFFIYYADVLFYRKRNKYICYAVIALGYVLHFVACIFGSVIVNTSTALIIHFICFKLCYHISNKSAAFQSVLLDAMNAASESIIIFTPYLGIIPNQPSLITPTQSFILTLASKVLYLTGIVIISHAFCDKHKKVFHSLI